MKRSKVLVAGGSIGGLTTALLLRDIGYDVEVFERSSAALQERGTGIVVLPITERYFVERGGEDNRVSLELSDWTYLDRSGTALSVDKDHFRFSGWSTIYQALLQAFGEEHYHLASEMVGFDQGADWVTLRLADGRRVDGDLLVCADGLSSTARRLLLPGLDPTYAGYVAWRSVTHEHLLSEATRAVLRDAMVYQILDRAHILVYAIPGPDGSVVPGRRTINSVWYRNAPDDGTFADLMTDVTGRRRSGTIPPGMIRPELVGDMQAATSELAPPIGEVVRATPDPLIQAIFDLETPQMVFGRVIIMGDAAFGLRPHVAAGQAKACADAWALRTALLNADHDIDTALARWEPLQLSLGRTASARTRDMGYRSQVSGTMTPGDKTWKFGLWEPGN